MSKYSTLLNILEQLRFEAPPSYKRYFPAANKTEKLDQARSRTFIHLFLKVKFGLLDFSERETHITDDTGDGGIDAYYIDGQLRVIYLIQSKFRTNEKNFESREIAFTELLNMDIERIIKEGCKEDEHNNRYNDKIQKLINKVQAIEDIARYEYKVIILANIREAKRSHLKKLVPGYKCDVYNFEKCYSELVFPMVSGTYYNASDLYLNIDLTNKDFSRSRISYPVETEHTDCEITVLFVPTIEIAKILYKYKNAILKFNPRSYLTLSKNPVNTEIANTIKNKNTNEFSLFNNGITMLSDETGLHDKVGRKNRAQLYVKNAQIINGGQTAYTLSTIYENAITSGEDAEKIFADKEVMLKVITFIDVDNNNELEILALIEAISKATNRQTAVQEADRRANDKIQIEIQKQLFEKYGYFYERKRGEYFDGLTNKYVDKSKVVDRETFLRVAHALQGFPAQARRNSDKVLFKEEKFHSILDDISVLENILFGYICFRYLDTLKKRINKVKDSRSGLTEYGHALIYGFYAVVYVAFFESSSMLTLENRVEECVQAALSKWLQFEDFVREQRHNHDYFRRISATESNAETLEANYQGYYKGRTLNEDLRTFFRITKRPSDSAQLEPTSQNPVTSYAKSSKPKQSTADIAASLEVKSGQDLFMAACVRLTFENGQDTFSRSQILDEMRKATDHYEKKFSKNLSRYIDQLVRQNKIVKLPDNYFKLAHNVKKKFE